ncbi:MAG: hypothetical protein J5793_02060 [Clostridia bacterium]|nr:hypothetical protein [Clostridia bacterium]
MDGDISEKLRSVLSDPGAMARIAAIAGNLSQKPPESEASQSVPAQEVTAAALPPALAERDPRVDLLYSLKPLLREEKREKVDSLARALSAVTVFRQLRK